MKDIALRRDKQEVKAGGPDAALSVWVAEQQESIEVTKGGSVLLS
jgi:hypothetical protein